MKCWVFLKVSEKLSVEPHYLLGKGPDYEQAKSENKSSVQFEKVQQSQNTFQHSVLFALLALKAFGVNCPSFHQQGLQMNLFGTHRWNDCGHVFI